MKRNNFFFILYVFIIQSVYSQNAEKIPLDHSVYDSWKELDHAIISSDGNWVSFEINPQKGDGWLYLINIETGKQDSVARGYDAEFSNAGKYLVFKIKPQYLVVREAKKAKKKKDRMPKDSLGIWVFKNDSIHRFERVKSFQISEKEGDWIVFHHEKKIPAKDTTNVENKEQDKKEKNKKDKEEGADLVIFNPVTEELHTFTEVTGYFVPEYGDRIGFISVNSDSLDHSVIKIFNTQTGKATDIWEKDGLSKNISLDNRAGQAAFIHSEDTGKAKVYSLYYWDKTLPVAGLVADTVTQGMPAGWSVSVNGDIFFSDDGEKLFCGTAPKPETEPEDTLLDDEKYRLDLWSWTDQLLQPQQNIQVEREQKRTYQAVIHLDNKRLVQLADELLPDVNLILKGDGDVVLGVSNLPYRKSLSWDANRYHNLYLVDLKTGERKLIKEKAPSRYEMSPYGKFVIWYETADSSWFSWSAETHKIIALTVSIDADFYDVLNDRPMDPRPYGVAGWIGEDKYVLIYDRFDLWKIDPAGEDIPENLTMGFGKENNTRLRYVRLDPEEKSINPKGEIILNAFHVYNKKSGFYRTGVKKPGQPDELIMGDYRYYYPDKAKNAGKLIWKRSTFRQYPDLWISDLNFKNHSKLSNTNPQQEKYLWGSVEVVEWMSFDHQQLQGLMYKPENFDPQKKYPMLVYFYERSSDGIHRHRIPSPSRSTINRAYSTSNGYIVFVPDIPYTIGYPGHSAYKAVVSGTMTMLNRYAFINPDRIGLNGQSWGGYQVAYLVTRTDLYKCAFSGAPVSNMTSAYGGIRWGSGMSRMFQYEQTQSRIGGTLWEKPIHYIRNSPLFFVPDIKTPLLIMHNDADGAVPWYQGIEFFVALRRLNKPAWLLSYNDESHNLTKWPNRKDLSIRMFQFYDHYLKGAPKPDWLINGIPAIQKGKEDGYEFEKKNP